MATAPLESAQLVACAYLHLSSFWQPFSFARSVVLVDPDEWAETLEQVDAAAKDSEALMGEQEYEEADALYVLVGGGQFDDDEEEDGLEETSEEEVHSQELLNEFADDMDPSYYDEGEYSWELTEEEETLRETLEGTEVGAPGYGVFCPDCGEELHVEGGAGFCPRCSKSLFHEPGESVDSVADPEAGKYEWRPFRLGRFTHSTSPSWRSSVSKRERLASEGDEESFDEQAPHTPKTYEDRVLRSPSPKRPAKKKKTAPRTSRHCPKCDKKVQKTADYCKSCGIRLGAYCPSCKTKVQKTANYCYRCGHQLKS